MSENTRTICLQITTDVTCISNDATRADLERYADNLAEAIGKQFDVKVHQVWHNHSGSRCNDPEINEWLRELERGDGWLQYLD